MGSRILLADDSITIQKVVNLTFQDEGIEVVSVSNGDMAEKRLKEVNPDLVLADIFMPGKNGYELCEAIKQDPELRTVPVVLLVGAFEPFNEAEARRVQADAHLTKPFESRVLVETVRSLMDKYPKAQPLPSAPQVVPEAGSFPNAQTIPNPPFNLDTALMGEHYPSASGNQEFPPSPIPTPQPEVAFTEQAPLPNFAEATPFEAKPFTDAFASPLQTGSKQPPTVTLDEPTTGQGNFPSTPDSLSHTQDFDVNSYQATVEHEEAPLQLDESVNLNPELITFYEQYDKSPSHQEATRVLGSYTPQVEPGTRTDTAFDLVVDFDKVDTLEEPKPDQIVGLEADAFTQSGEAERAIFKPTEAPTDAASAAKKFDTNELESTTARATSTDVNPIVPPVNGSAVGYPGNFASPTPSAESSPASEILATDEPLGDVLTNLPPLEESPDAVNVQSPLELDDPYMPVKVYAASESPNTAASEPDRPLVDAQAVPVHMADATIEEPTSSKAFDLSPQPLPEIVNAGETGLPEPQHIDTLSATQTPVKTFAPPVAEEAKTTTTPVAAETPSPYNGLEKGGSEAVNLLTEFTPVNLETVIRQSPAGESPVRESVSETSLESMNASQAFDHQQDSVLELPSLTESEAVNHQGGDMSQEMIDEIVRRVVAQLSDRVVREIAWEVVPDCVERVVNNLTREGIHNKLTN